MRSLYDHEMEMVGGSAGFWEGSFSLLFSGVGLVTQVAIDWTFQEKSVKEIKSIIRSIGASLGYILDHRLQDGGEVLYDKLIELNSAFRKLMDY